MRVLRLLFILLSFNASSQILFVGNHVIEPYFGFPNVSKYLPTIALLYEPKTVTSFRGLPPSGFRYTYMLTDEISFGVDVMYNHSVQKYTQTDTIFVNGNWEYPSYKGERIQSRLRVQARMNFHIPISQPNADSYFGIGFGTNNRWIKNYKEGELTETMKGKEASLIPFSMRVCYGYRYYFGYNLGITGEIGIGGPLFSFGLSYKL